MPLVARIRRYPTLHIAHAAYTRAGSNDIGLSCVFPYSALASFPFAVSLYAHFSAT